MKKEITDYKPAEETTTRIACGSCDERWDDRNDDGVNTIVLDIQIQERHSYGRSRWRDRLFDGHHHGDDYLRMTGAEVEDYCDSCFDGLFPDDSAAEVEESEFYVKEETREEYYCDFCEEGMGENPDHGVSVNPRIRIEPWTRAGVTRSERRRDRKSRVLTHKLNTRVTGDKDMDKLHADRDSVHDCCDSCASEMFNLGVTSSSGSRGLLARLLGM